MAMFRLNDVIPLRKNLPMGGDAVVEADYSLRLKHNGATKYLNATDVTFVILQPTPTVDGYIDATITVDATYEDGSYTVELLKTKTSGEGISAWTTVAGSARFSIEKAVVTALVL